MNKLLPILLLSCVLAGELEVDGNLKVQGTIDAQNNPITNVGIPQTLNDAINGNVLQDALRDDGQYEINYYAVSFYNAFTSGSDIFETRFKEIGQSGYTYNWEPFVNQLLIDGWIISRAFSLPMSYNVMTQEGINILYELKLPIEE